ncbi:hypothetical protein EGW08_013871 [Elysia chlorotica]|uniref:Nuclear pore complex protein Nup153 n=1 Tax=Elysia chlorotica TaxID=188477 RepID=A0A3S0ZMF6_ELYCH|nr:hypothetical protein EGW08_013871 [Elysia chlorotica]
MFKKPAGTWECDVCMVQNAPSATRCVACDAPKPGLEAAGIVSKKSDGSSISFAPGGGFAFTSLPTSSAATSSSGFKFGNSSNSTPSTSLPAPSGFVFGQTKPSSTESIPTTTSNSLSQGFRFGSSEMTTGGITASQASSASGSSVEPQYFTKTSTASHATAQIGLGSVQKASIDSTKNDTISAVVEVRPEEKLTSKTNGDTSSDNSNKSFSSNFVFGSTGATPAVPPSTNATQSALQSATSQPAVPFNFSVPKSNVATQETGKSANPTSGLFQFGVSPGGPSVNNNTGLGMGSSLACGKALVNGGFGTDSTAKTGFPAFSGFGQNSFTTSTEGSTSSQANKRTTGSEDAAAPPAKKLFTFGSTNKEATQNGGFHFGAAAQSSAPNFGVSGAAASAPAPLGGFGFGSNATKFAAPQPSGPAAGGGFNFNSDATANAGFNFMTAAAAAKPSEPPAQAFKAGLTASFNFGSVAQPSNAPFQFGAKPAENAASAASTFAAPQIQQSNGPSFGSVPSGMGTVGSFSLGVGDTNQRRVKKAVRRVTRK